VRSDTTLFDPASGTSTTGSMGTARAFHTLTVMLNGQMLAVGGETQNSRGQFGTTASAELFTP